MDLSKESILVIGAGISGLVTAKELQDAGFRNITIFEKENCFGGVWRKFCWGNLTLTSSKWMTEFSSYPLSDQLPDFLTPEQMLEYLESFSIHFGIKNRIKYNMKVLSINSKESQQGYVVEIAENGAQEFDRVVICAGLHGKPRIKNYPGMSHFSGEIKHGNTYKEPSSYVNKRVLCLGLGESGVGISTEISKVAKKTIVSASNFYVASRVFSGNNLPFDQFQFWSIGRYIRDYQELLTIGQSWVVKLPKLLRPSYIKRHKLLNVIPREWMPTAIIPNFWAAKFWPYDTSNKQTAEGNLTRPDAPSDDILALVGMGRIKPKGKVSHFESNNVVFLDGTEEEVDVVIANTGFEPAVNNIAFPHGWQYKHEDLYKGCFHPEMPGMAFVGFVRPTVGSIPAMAEMQARFVCAVFSGQVSICKGQVLEQLVKAEAVNHRKKNPVLTKNWPHIYFFDQWMEEMAELIGCRPSPWGFIRSWKTLKTYFFGAPMPLRFRIFGLGRLDGAQEKYISRVDQYLNNPLQKFAIFYVTLGFLYPYILSVLTFTIAKYCFDFTFFMGFIIACAFLFLYMKVELFRFVFYLPLLFPLFKGKK